MGELDSIVSVNITRETTVPTQAGFGTGLLLGQSGIIPVNTVREYASLSEVANDFTSSDPEYQAAQAYFGQAIKPQKIKIAEASPNGGAFVLKQAAASDLSVDINGTTVTGADLATLATNIAALDSVASAAVKDTNYLLVVMNDGYAATVQNVTADTGTLTLIQGNISAWDFGTAFDTSVSLTIDGTAETSAVSYADLVDEAIANVALTVADGFADGNVVYLIADGSTPNVLTAGLVNAVAAGEALDLVTSTMADILGNLSDVDSDFYAVMSISFAEQNVLSIAGWVEANEKLFATRTNDSDMLTAPDTTSISYQVSQLGYDRTFVCYHSLASSQYLDAAILGRQLPEDAGSVDWDLIQLSGVTPDALESGQITAIQSTDGNFYRTIGGVNAFSDGKVASGEWIDIIRGTDWLKARMQERIFTTLVNAKKVPYTNRGIGIIEADVRAQLDDGVIRTLINPNYTVTVTDVADVSAADKGNRVYNGISFDATYQGAIHKVGISGTIGL